MAEKQPTEAMPKPADAKPSAKGSDKRDGLIPQDKRGAGGGGPFGPKDADKNFHGGQSGAAYHGHGQLGEENVEGQTNVNAVSEDD